MKNPHRWLHIIRRGEKIVSAAFAVTAFWLFLWSEFWPEEEGRVLAIAHMIILVCIGLVLELTAWSWKTVLLEQIDEEKSEQDWKEIRESRWPSG